MAAAMVGTGPDSDGELRARGDRSRTVGLVFGPAGGAACVAACTNLAAHGVTAHICGERRRGELAAGTGVQLAPLLIAASIGPRPPGLCLLYGYGPA